MHVRDGFVYSLYEYRKVFQHAAPQCDESHSESSRQVSNGLCRRRRSTSQIEFFGLLPKCFSPGE